MLSRSERERQLEERVQELELDVERLRRVAFDGEFNLRTRDEVMRGLTAGFAKCKRCMGGGYTWLSNDGLRQIRPMPMRPCDCTYGEKYRAALEISREEGRQEVRQEARQAAKGELS